MKLFLWAEDVLFFRDGRPFNAGSDHEALSIFPPPPSVMQGIIRSHYLMNKDVPLQKEVISSLVGTATDYKGLRLIGPWLARWENNKLVRYFPTPSDAYLQDEQAKRISPMWLYENPGNNSLSEMPYLLSPFRESGKISKNAPGEYVCEEDLIDYLLHGKTVSTIKEEELFEREMRLGIQLDSQKRSTKEGMLYEVQCIRLCRGVGLYLEVNGYSDLPPQGMMRAGGEGRTLNYHALNDSEHLQNESSTRLGYKGALPERFKVYFASPAYFSQGWQPKSWGQFFSGEVKLEAVALNGYQVLGGYDYAENREKPAMRWVPAGSVYFFSHSGNASLRTGLIQQAITEQGAEIGYGQVIITNWDYQIKS
ncbi:MAG: type III-B CRISPR module-associated protein Cmr3 [Anaerolineales bacterium]